MSLLWCHQATESLVSHCIESKNMFAKVDKASAIIAPCESLAASSSLHSGSDQSDQPDMDQSESDQPDMDDQSGSDQPDMDQSESDQPDMDGSPV